MEEPMSRKFFLSRCLGIAALIILSLLIWAACVRSSHTKLLRVTFLDVGQGESILIEPPSGQDMLIDGGGASDRNQVDSTNVGLRTVVPYLHYRGISRLAVVLLTQPQGDHCGGLTAVLREESVGAILDGAIAPFPSADYREFRQEIRQRHIPSVHAMRGMRINLGDGVSADILNPPASAFPPPTAPGRGDQALDNDSVVLRLNYGRTHFLFTSDAQAVTEQALLAEGCPLSADVLQAGHGGSADATGDDWLTRVHPGFAAISCGKSASPSPSLQLLARLAAHHVTALSTASNGAILFISDGRTVTAHPFLR
jgi:competence protein ComEC